MVKDINPGGSSYPASFTNVNGTLFFSASEGASGVELWKSDGTATGTTLVKDIYPGSTAVYYQWSYGGWWSDVLNSSSPRYLTNAYGTLFFTANDGTHGRELWKSDGSEAGTVLVEDIGPWSNPASLANVNGTLFFTDDDDGTHGQHLWQSDGTAAGTMRVANLSVSALTDVGGTLFFSAYDGIHGSELWLLADDGASQGTTLNVSGFPATIKAGAAGSFTVIAKNADGSTNTSYLGSVHFTSSDPQAVLPAGYSFTAADKGAHTFSATLKTAGSQSITVTDNFSSNISGSETGITVTPA
ncbi:MAG TPA: ELWxxDGT repeat protein, partial [Pirellulales bacterium]